jgi:hypothetical protein
VVIGRPRLTELAVLTDRAGDSDRQNKEHSLFVLHSFYFWFPCDGDPLDYKREGHPLRKDTSTLDYKREGHPLRKDTSIDLDHTTSSARNLVIPLTLTQAPGLNQYND